MWADAAQVDRMNASRRQQVQAALDQRNALGRAIHAYRLARAAFSHHNSAEGATLPLLRECHAAEEALYAALDAVPTPNPWAKP